MAAAAVDMLLWLLGRLLGVPFRVWPGDGGSEVVLGPLAIIGATLFASLLAGLAAGIMGRLVRSPVPWIAIGGLIVTLASLTNPWGQPDQVPTSTRVLLTVVHVVTGALVTFGLARGIWTDDRALR